jgi:hypothetical protein
MNTEDNKFIKKDWRCLKCNYLNFKRNIFCKKCYTDKNGNEYIFNDWICHKCLFINEIDCRVGKIKNNLKCEECDYSYSLQNTNCLKYNMCAENDYSLIKKFYEKLGVFVDWDCIKNIDNAIFLCIKLVCRKYISKNNIIYGINNIIAARNPFNTIHNTSCQCDSCSDLD